MQKAVSKVTNIHSIGVEKEYFSKIFEDNPSFSKDESLKNEKSQPDINLIFTKDFINLIKLLKDKVYKHFMYKLNNILENIS